MAGDVGWGRFVVNREVARMLIGVSLFIIFAVVVYSHVVGQGSDLTMTSGLVLFATDWAGSVGVVLALVVKLLASRLDVVKSIGKDVVQGVRFVVVLLQVLVVDVGFRDSNGYVGIVQVISPGMDRSGGFP